MTTDELERQLTGVLRDTLDREVGPHPTWSESPAARRVAKLDVRRRWPLRVLAVAALLGASVGAALLVGAPNKPAVSSNGWIAYTDNHENPAGGDPDTDIWFTGLNQQPRRVIGSDSDVVDQACPAFSPDGRSLAYGSVRGLWSTVTADVADPRRNAALVIADVADDGTVADRLTIYVGDGVPPPCPVWTHDGSHLAFAVPRTSPINPDRSGEGSEVWVVQSADGDITVIPDLLATDLEWSPDGLVLAIAGGPETAATEGVVRNGLQDAHIHLYELATGALHTLDTPPSLSSLSWSPDGKRIAYASHPPSGDLYSVIWVIDVETGQREELTAPYMSLSGIGPVWSPDGQTIAYQRSITMDTERAEVVLVTPGDRSQQTREANEVVMPNELVTTDGTSLTVYPLRVSWSPDGAYLLYVARAYPDGNPEEKWVVAVPTDPGAPAVGLATGAASSAMGVASQVWQRR